MYSNYNQIQIKASSRQPSAFQFRLMVGIVAIGFIAGTIALQFLHWQGNRSLHTIMEIIATLLATFVGLLAFLRFYSRKSSSYLLLATGFIGTALLDGYHAVVTSSLLGYIMPSPPDSLIPWSWNASRTFLAILMAIMWFVSRWEKKHGRANILPEAVVIIAVGGLSLTSFCFFAFYPLPRAYYPEFFFGRPEEFVAAFFLQLPCSVSSRKPTKTLARFIAGLFGRCLSDLLAKHLSCRDRLHCLIYLLIWPTL